MAFHQWIFNGRIKKHLVQLDHDPKIRELKIRLNGEMVFNVFPYVAIENYFNILIDGQLCVVKVKKQEHLYDYDFYEVPRKKYGSQTLDLEEMRITRWLSIAAIAVIVLVSGLLFYRNVLMPPTTETAVAQIISVSNTPDGEGFAYLYLVDGQPIKHRITTADSTFPVHFFNALKPGQQYRVQYTVGSPEAHFLQLDHPTAETLEDLKSDAIWSLEQRAPKEHRERWTAFSICVVETYYRKLGVRGLSLINAPRKELENTQELFYLWQAELDCAKYHLLRPEHQKNPEHDELQITHPKAG